LSQRFGVLPGFLIIFWMTPSIASLNVTNSDTSLAIISARHTHGGADLRVNPCRRTNPPEFLLETECSMEFSVPLARRGEIPARPCRKAFWLPGGPDFPRMPA